MSWSVERRGRVALFLRLRLIGPDDLEAAQR
jgi:hypothetical protein